MVDITTGVKSPEMVRYCYEQIKVAKAHDFVNEDKFHSYLQGLKRLHLMIIMGSSQQTKDELQFKQYLKITHGRISPAQFLSPLKNISFFKYYSQLKNSLKKYSLQGNQAETLLIFLL